MSSPTLVGHGGLDMDDAKRAYREAENKTKEAIRRSDGDESPADKLGNLGDDVRQGLGNAGDEAREEVDRLQYKKEHGEDPV
jgi:hypothetical protein